MLNFKSLVVSFECKPLKNPLQFVIASTIQMQRQNVQGLDFWDCFAIYDLESMIAWQILNVHGSTSLLQTPNL